METVILTEIFYPDTTSTGHYLAEIARKLLEVSPVRVICSAPSGCVTYERREAWMGIDIVRIGKMSPPKCSILRRCFNGMFTACRMLVYLLGVLHRRGIVIVVTNPPMLPLVAALGCLVKRGRLVVVVHDLYPHAAIVSGLIAEGGVISRVTTVAMRWVFRRAVKIITLGRDMNALILKTEPTVAKKIETICHWADTHSPTAILQKKEMSTLTQRLGVREKFVVLHAGNLGRTHDWDVVLKAAATLRSESAVCFVFVVSPLLAPRLREEKDSLGLQNILIVPMPADRSSQWDTLGAADVVLISFKKGMTGVSVPSRMYNAMAAGKPIIAVAGSESELGLVIQEEGIGWVVSPGDHSGLSEAILLASDAIERTVRMGMAAQVAVENKYSSARCLNQYAASIASVRLH